MAERPILFSLPMVQAIQTGNKTQTRRAVKLPKKAKWGTEYDGQVIFDDGSSFGQDIEVDELKCPYGQVGDFLWVRETYCLGVKDNGEDVTIYKASVDDQFNEFRGLWRPSIFMPRKYSRILLEITGIRVERLHSISKEDAIAEGIGFDVIDQAIFFKNYMSKSHFADDDFCNLDDTNAPKKSYFSLWESINGRESLDANPWVWVIEFKVVEIKQ